LGTAGPPVLSAFPLDRMPASVPSCRLIPDMAFASPEERRRSLDRRSGPDVDHCDEAFRKKPDPIALPTASSKAKAMVTMATRSKFDIWYVIAALRVVLSHQAKRVFVWHPDPGNNRAYGAQSTGVPLKLGVASKRSSPGGCPPAD
jgi:hypothetical protein